MEIYNNDRTDASIGTNFPFQYGSPTTIDKFALPENSFISIRIYLDDGYIPPARISAMYVRTGHLYIDFSDNGNQLIGHWAVDTDLASAGYVSGFIYDDHNVLCGHVVCSPQFPGLLRGIVNYCGGSVTTKSGSFILLPQCCVCLYKGKLKAFDTGLGWSTADADIRADSNINLTVDSNPVTTHPADMQFNMFGSYSSISMPPMDYNEIDDSVDIGKPGITDFVACIYDGEAENERDKYDVKYEFNISNRSSYVINKDSNIIIKSGISSNLRVITDNSINLKGVLDA